jgi:hypothetical protein
MSKQGEITGFSLLECLYPVPESDPIGLQNMVFSKIRGKTDLFCVYNEGNHDDFSDGTKREHNHDHR